MINTIMKSIREYTASSILAPVFMVGECAAEVSIPVIMSLLLDKLQDTVGTSELNWILIYGAILFVLGCVSLTCGTLSAFYAAKASSGLAKNLRRDIFDKVQSFSFKNIDNFTQSSLVTRMTTDITNIKEAYQVIIRIGIRAPLMMIFSLIMTFVINWEFAIYVLIALIVMGVIVFTIMLLAIPNFKRAFNRYDRVNSELQENVKGIRVVKTYVREDYEKEKFKKASADLKNEFFKGEFILTFNTPSSQFFVYLMITLVCTLGSFLIVRSNEADLSLGQMQSLLQYSMMMLMSIMMLSMILVMIGMSLASAKRVYEVLTEVPDIKDPENPIYEVKDGSVVFDHVSFKYSATAEKNALNEINLNIPSGTTVGIFGSTGSSKSTLVNMICRLYDVTEGSVKVGGVDVKEYDLKTLRDSVSVVLQKNVLFKGTIKENLMWGDENATDEEIEHAAKLAQAHEFIMNFKEGYNHMIEQGGTNVSGGQKQRLCIARALLKKPKILILDDSTSAVDTKTDKLIRQAFKEYIPETTKFIIGQRVSSIMDADMIIIMDNGSISQIGTHEELLKTNKIYQEVYYSQTNVTENLGGNN